MTRLLTLSVFLVCISNTSGICQEDYSRLDSLIDSIEEYNNSYYENIYVHTNKGTYQPGESIWFKAYVTGPSNLSSNSKSLFAQLYDSTKNLIGIERYLIVNGVSSGNFSLNTNLISGTYYLVFSTYKSKIADNAFIKLIVVNSFKFPKNIDFDKLRTPEPQTTKPKRLTLTSKNDSLVIRYRTSTHENYHILLQVNEELLWANTKSGNLKVSIPFDLIPKGVATAYCFYQDNNLLEKASLPIKLNQKTNTIAVTKNQKKDDKLIYQFELKNASNKPLRGHLSASVYLKELNPNYGEEENIVAYSLTRESAYVKGVSDSLIRDIVDDKYVISGKVCSPPKKYETVKISAVDINQGKFYETTVDSEGEFRIEINEEDYNCKFVVGANYKDKPLDVSLYDTIKYDFFSPKLNYYDFPKSDEETEYYSSEDRYAKFKDYLDHQILPEIVVSAKRVNVEKKDTIHNTKLFSYLSNVKVEEVTKDRLNIIAGDDLLSVLRNYTSFGLVRELPGQRLVYFSKSYGTSILSPPPVLFVVDGYPRGTNLLLLNDINLNLIKSIRIIRNLSAVVQFGSEARGGVILIDTEGFISPTTQPSYYQSESKVATSSYYNTKRPFEPSENLESCILWEDQIDIDDNGKFTLEFENPEFSGTMVLKIEGIDSNLNFVSFTKDIKTLSF